MPQNPKKTTEKRIVVKSANEDRKSIEAPVQPAPKAREAIRSSIKIIRRSSGDERVSKSLHYSGVEGAFSSAAGNITGTYTTPLALALNASNAQIGLLSSLQNLASTFAQIPGARFSAWLGSRKRAWVVSSLIQRLLWIPIIILPFLGLENPIMILILLLAVISFFASLRGPGWSSLMGDLVPKTRWGKYFGWRNTVTGIAGLVAILAAGQILVWFGFSILFTIALVLGFLSIYFFIKMYEPSFKREYHYTHSIKLRPGGWLNAIRVNRNFAYFTLFMAAMNFAVGLAAPFFTVYMLKDMNIGYGWYAALIVIEAFVTIISQPYWGRLCDRIGDRKVMIVNAILICFYPVFWLFITNPYEIIVANIFSGFAWAGFGMAAFNFMLAASPQERRAEFTANHSFFAGLGVVFGALTGGLLAEYFRSNALLWFYGLQAVFLISFIARLACLVVLPKLRETRVEERGPPLAEVFWRTVAMNPVRGIVHAIIHPNYKEWEEGFLHFFRSIRDTIVYKIKMWRNR